MAKPKGDKQADGVDLAEGALIDVPIDELYNPEINAIGGLVRQYGDVRSNLCVYRQGPGGHRDLVYLFECTPSEWLSDGPARLQRDYGKGTYRIHLHNDAGQMLLNKAIPVEALPASRVVAEKVAVVGAHGADSAVMAALAGIGESMKLMAQAIAATQSRNPLEGLAGLKEIAGIVKDMMPPVINPAPAQNNVEQTLGLFRTIMDISKSFAPPATASPDDDVQDFALKKGIDLIGRMFEQSQGGAAQPPAAVSAPALAAPGVQVLTQEQLDAANVPQGEDMGIAETLELQALKLQLRMANREAAKNADPVAYAESIEPLLTDEVFDMLESDPKWFDYVVAQVPECAQFRSWYDRLRAALLAMVNAPELPEVPAIDLTLTQKASTVPPLTRQNTPEKSDGANNGGASTGDTGGKPAGNA